MKKLLLLVSIVLIFAIKTNAQGKTPERLGYEMGYDLAAYVKNTFVLPNIPPKAAFQALKIDPNPNPVLQPDGTYKQLRKFSLVEPADVSQLLYNNFAAMYAYDNGLFDYYFNELRNAWLSAQSMDESIYYNSAMTGFGAAMSGVAPVENNN